jgi:broad specificity polyphosphatase/5'/3'-nucleotidase SurE
MTLEQNDRLILITNDDGLYASGLKTLIEVMEEFGKIVLVSTPESMSGTYSKNPSQGQIAGRNRTKEGLYLQWNANRHRETGC